MAKARVFIDGQAGTTGLRIRELLSGRTDLELLEIEEAHRKDARRRAELLNRASVSILCLPDDAARDAAALLENEDARIIDSSTAHRVATGWTYGLPELAPGQRERIASARLVSNPGCYPTGVLLLVRPLIDGGIIVPEVPLTIHALSGYTGGGNALIAKWENPADSLSSLPFEAPYALERRHKHVPEMIAHGRLAAEPFFVPAVGPFRCGMRIEIPLHASMLAAGADGGRVLEALRARYAAERFVEVVPMGADAPDERAFDPRSGNDSNRVRLHVLPHPSGHVLLVAILDNLGKGAAGAAVQNLNLMLGLPEATSLE
jgi:N-acetyl-gamma-glutamyl-phosphate reductase